MITNLYNIKARNTFKLSKATDDEKTLHAFYGKLITESYDGILPFSNKPTPEEALGWLKFLRPNVNYKPDSVEITYIGKYDTNG